MWNRDIEMDIEVNSREGVEWIRVPQNVDMWKTFMTTIMSQWDSIKFRKFL